MSPRWFLRRRPSAALLVSFLALFVSLGGAGWAALRLPRHSVGNSQLQNFSVGNAKLRPNSVSSSKISVGAVGARQVNPTQVQLRVFGPCSTGAIQSIAQAGNVTCTPVLPNEYGTSAQTTMIGTSATQVASESLPAGSTGTPYLAIGNVQWHMSENASGPQSVDLTCTLQSLAASNSGEVIGNLDTNRSEQRGTIPILLPLTAAGSSPSVQISCGFTATPDSPAPTVTASATLNAIQTAANN